MREKSTVKAGGVIRNHNQTIVRRRPKGMKVKTDVKAGREPEGVEEMTDDHWKLVNYLR